MEAGFELLRCCKADGQIGGKVRVAVFLQTPAFLVITRKAAGGLSAGAADWGVGRDAERLGRRGARRGMPQPVYAARKTRPPVGLSNIYYRVSAREIKQDLLRRFSFYHYEHIRTALQSNLAQSN
jgi:hypothetical protein